MRLFLPEWSREREGIKLPSGVFWEELEQYPDVGGWGKTGLSTTESRTQKGSRDCLKFKMPVMLREQRLELVGGA